jgi:stress-induced-phosphoprotein 1
MASEKELGTKAFQAKDFETAIKHFSVAIEQNPQDHALFSNRSACHFNQNNFDQAASDAEECINVKPDWAKGYMRKGLAL